LLADSLQTTNVMVQVSADNTPNNDTSIGSSSVLKLPNKSGSELFREVEEPPTEETEMNDDDLNVYSICEVNNMRLVLPKTEATGGQSVIVHSESPESSSSSSNNGSGSAHPQVEKRHVCEICGKGFPYLSILESHKRCHTGEKPFSCHFCDKKFAQKATLQVHERTHTGERPYKCKYCEKTFAQYGTKTVHEKSAHLGIRNYKCPKCSKCLSSPSALYTHKKTHGEKTFQCEFCPKTFTLKNYLKLHVKQVHEQNERKHICQYCKKSFAYAGSLQVHVRTHTGERPYMCKYCPKAFASQGNLQSHERTHTGERPYSCTQCGRSFIQKSQLTAHEATHQYQPATSPDSILKKPNDYVCKYCGKRYAYASSLYVHTRLHTGERPFRCSFCDKAFTNQGNMQVHQRVHTGEKPYKCNACEKSYAQKVGLKIHLEQCQQYLNGRGLSPEEDGDKPSTLENLIPQLLSLQDGGIPLTSFQYPGQQQMQTALAPDRNSPTSLGLKLPTVPATIPYSPPGFANKGFVEYISGSTESTPSPLLDTGNNTVSPLKPVPQLPDVNQSAFHGVTPDPFKSGAILDSFDPQLMTLKRLVDGAFCSPLITPQLLLQNQQLQMLLQSSDRWYGLLTAQPLPLFPHVLPSLSSLASLLPNIASPPAVIQSGFVPPTIKNEPAMLV
uniref:C2H2-type domain-containing protein n=1 Tax=Parascaris univalens TaxID=6257 RepID=A0A915BFE1_PARUN